jgi:hypothetical protein
MVNIMIAMETVLFCHPEGLAERILLKILQALCSFRMTGNDNAWKF